MWRACYSPTVWSLAEIITIKQITISFSSPTLSELKTSGPRPKTPSPQALPARDQAVTSTEGKEGTAPVSKRRPFPSVQPPELGPRPPPITTASVPLPFLPFLPSPNNGEMHISLSFSASECETALEEEGGTLSIFYPHLGSFRSQAPSCIPREASPGPA